MRKCPLSLATDVVWPCHQLRSDPGRTLPSSPACISICSSVQGKGGTQCFLRPLLSWTLNDMPSSTWAVSSDVSGNLQCVNSLGEQGVHKSSTQSFYINALRHSAQYFQKKQTARDSLRGIWLTREAGH